MKKPSVFIGSSSEGIEAARAIAFQLSDTAEVTIWNEGVFEPTQGYLQSLVNALDRFDFAVLVFTPDDESTHRGDDSHVPRDNVMFELGLFLGRLGASRVFVIRSDQPLRIPSDLHGVTVLRYDAKRSDGNLRAAVSSACVPIRDAVRDLGLADTRSLQQIQKTSSQLQTDVEQAVQILAKARAYETELFLKYQGGRILNDEETRTLRNDVEALKRVVETFEPKDAK